MGKEHSRHFIYVSLFFGLYVHKCRTDTQQKSGVWYFSPLPFFPVVAVFLHTFQGFFYSLLLNSLLETGLDLPTGSVWYICCLSSKYTQSTALEKQVHALMCSWHRTLLRQFYSLMIYKGEHPRAERSDAFLGIDPTDTYI